MDYQSVTKLIDNKSSSQWTGFDQIAKIALFWVEHHDDYNRFIDLGQKIHAGDKPTISKDDEVMIGKLFNDMRQVGGINADDSFWIVTLWCYCYGERVISMTDLAKWLIVYRNKKTLEFGNISQWIHDLRQSGYDLSDVSPTLTKTQRSFATHWVRYNQMPVYNDPTSPNPYMNNKVLSYDVALKLQFDKDQ